MPALKCLLCAILVLTIAVAFTGSSSSGGSDQHVLKCNLAAVQTIPIVVLLNEVTNISCQFSKIEFAPFALKIERNGVSINSGENGTSWHVQEGTVTINVTVSVLAIPSNNGSFVNCLFGCTTDKAQFIIVEDIPSPPTGLTASFLGLNTINVSWAPPWPHPVNSYTLSVNQTPFHHPTIISTGNTMATVQVNASTADSALSVSGSCSKVELTVNAHTDIGTTSWSNTTVIGIPIDFATVDVSFLQNMSKIVEDSTGLMRIEMEARIPVCGKGPIQYQFNITSQNDTSIALVSSRVLREPIYTFSPKELTSSCSNGYKGVFDVFARIVDIEANQEMAFKLYSNIGFTCDVELITSSIEKIPISPTSYPLGLVSSAVIHPISQQSNHELRSTTLNGVMLSHIPFPPSSFTPTPSLTSVTTFSSWIKDNLVSAALIILTIFLIIGSFILVVILVSSRIIYGYSKRKRLVAMESYRQSSAEPIYAVIPPLSSSLGSTENLKIITNGADNNGSVPLAVTEPELTRKRLSFITNTHLINGGSSTILTSGEEEEYVEMAPKTNPERQVSLAPVSPPPLNSSVTGTTV